MMMKRNRRANSRRRAADEAVQQMDMELENFDLGTGDELSLEDVEFEGADLGLDDGEDLGLDDGEFEEEVEDFSEALEDGAEDFSDESDEAGFDADELVPDEEDMIDSFIDDDATPTGSILARKKFNRRKACARRKADLEGRGIEDEIGSEAEGGRPSVSTLFKDHPCVLSEGDQKRAIRQITARLDRLANYCERHGMKKTAFQIDKVSDRIERG